MIRSMTAFSREESRSDLGELIWEIRSVNHRYLEVFVRLPEELRALEPLVRETVGRLMARGKVECTLRYKTSGVTPVAMNVNEAFIRQLLEASGQVQQLINSQGQLSVTDVMRWPGVLEAETVDLGEVQKKAIELLETALANLVEAREREGVQLAGLIEQRLEDMSQQVELAKQRMPEVISALRDRLQAKLADFADLDEGRVVTMTMSMTMRGVMSMMGPDIALNSTTTMTQTLVGGS